MEILLSITIVLLPIWWTIPWLGNCWEWGWGYKDNTIYVCMEYQQSQDTIIYHELWHHIWRTILTESQKLQYKELFDRDKNHKDRFSREYSRTNEEEDFCDNYSLLARKQKPKNIFLKKRIHFISSIKNI